jgi:hypothetical protein
LEISWSFPCTCTWLIKHNFVSTCGEVEV